MGNEMVISKKRICHLSTVESQYDKCFEFVRKCFIQQDTRPGLETTQQCRHRPSHMVKKRGGEAFTHSHARRHRTPNGQLRRLKWNPKDPAEGVNTKTECVVDRWPPGLKIKCIKYN
jgi:hypothetical protein